MTADRPDTDPRTEAACPTCGHDVDHTTACPGGCPKCASPRQRFIDNVLVGGLTDRDREYLNRSIDAIIEAEAAQGAAPLDFAEWVADKTTDPEIFAEATRILSEGTAPRAEGLDVERLIGCIIRLDIHDRQRTAGDLARAIAEEYARLSRPSDERGGEG